MRNVYVQRAYLLVSRTLIDRIDKILIRLLMLGKVIAKRKRVKGVVMFTISEEQNDIKALQEHGYVKKEYDWEDVDHAQLDRDTYSSAGESRWDHLRGVVND